LHYSGLSAFLDNIPYRGVIPKQRQHRRAILVKGPALVKTGAQLVGKLYRNCRITCWRRDEDRGSQWQLHDAASSYRTYLPTPGPRSRSLPTSSSAVQGGFLDAALRPTCLLPFFKSSVKQASAGAIDDLLAEDALVHEPGEQPLKGPETAGALHKRRRERDH
jgi:hypothetical protein